MSFTSKKSRVLLFLLTLCLLVGAASVTVLARASVRTSTDLTVLPAEKGAATPPPSVSAASMLLLEPASGTVLAEKDADTRRPMASTTKIMTALLVSELMDPDTVVRVPADAVGIEGSSIYLFTDEEITVRTLLYGLLLSSANDAAAALALVCAGSIEAFADQMNRKAAELSLTDTHFTNPHGLHDSEHYTTARDLARLAAALLEVPLLAEIVSTARYVAPQNGTDASRLFLNHNRLLASFDGAIGVKTGFTKASGRCLVSAARRDGLTLIAVTLSAPNDWQDHTALLDWGFASYRAFTPTLPDFSLPVVGGTATEVALLAKAPAPLLLPAAHGEVTCRVEAPHFLYAGFDGGLEVGRALFFADGKQLCALPLYTAAGVPTPAAPSLLARLRSFFGNLIKEFI